MRADLKNLHNYGFGTLKVCLIKEREIIICGRDLISQKKLYLFVIISTRKILKIPTKVLKTYFSTTIWGTKVSFLRQPV